MFKKRIALIGTAPSSIDLAPYGDESWSILACSPGCAWKVNRADAWMEIHAFNPSNPDDPVCSREYLEKIDSLNCKAVYMIEPVSFVRNSVPYPKDEMVRKHGPWFFTSSLSWMFALALEQNPEEIGLWGVDMAANEEVYSFQKAGCHYFIQEAMKRGIKVTIPLESDLAQPPPLYGFDTAKPMAVKGNARKRELSVRLANAEHTFEAKRADHFWHRGAVENNQQWLTRFPDDEVGKARNAELEQKVIQSQQELDNAKSEFLFLKGALDDCDYWMRTWLAARPHMGPKVECDRSGLHTTETLERAVRRVA
jgi:hypothetical protein